MHRSPPHEADDPPCALCDVGPVDDPGVAVRARRRVLRDLALAGGAAVAAPLLLPGVALAAPTGARRRTLVCVFLRGGLDGLATVAPMDDDDLGRARPGLAVDGMLPLGRGFGLHPAAAPLLDLVVDGRLGVVHAVGTSAPLRSHFEAQHHVDAGGSTGRDGWLARLLVARSPGSPLAAVAVGPRTTPALRGHHAAVALQDLDVTAPSLPGDPAGAADALAAMTAAQPTVAATGVTSALAALAALEDADVASVPAGDGYPGSGLGLGLSQVARMLRAGVPIDVACVDAGGFDLHADLAVRHPVLLDDLARSLAAFAADLGDQLDDVVVLAVSEFGRRLTENGSGGSDHGRGGVALLLGGGVVGGVHGAWPGLADQDVERPRPDGPAADLAVATDVRDVLADCVRATATTADDTDAVLQAVLPGHDPTPTGAVA